MVAERPCCAIVGRMRNSRVPRAGPAASVLGAIAIAACQPEPHSNGTDKVMANGGARQAPPLPIPEPSFGREQLLLAVARAASAHAAGAEDAEAQRALDGKRFEVRLRFGCVGLPVESARSGWTFDPDERVLRVRVQPNLAFDDPAVRGSAGPEVEAVEGFWLHRPWMLTPACPRRAAPAQPDGDELARATTQEPQAAAISAAPQRVGIAQFFTATDSRTRRRSSRPFEAVRTLEQGQAPPAQGLNLVLSGRLKALPGGRVIACTSADLDRPPDCVASADIDRVRLERPEDGEVLAEWSMG